ncbi:unnamed protein product [Prorocentrum cordatum]|uniref:Uncharacterized protein n=1 Tax=Prorocentrum cordatum TaxID=2364126 RepID=A0ABN9SYY8_9DINO|nr:unnamed protein product [Polarella glacialis]
MTLHGRNLAHHRRSVARHAVISAINFRAIAFAQEDECAVLFAKLVSWAFVIGDARADPAVFALSFLDAGARCHAKPMGDFKIEMDIDAKLQFKELADALSARTDAVLSAVCKRCDPMLTDKDTLIQKVGGHM